MAAKCAVNAEVARRSSSSRAARPASNRRTARRSPRSDAVIGAIHPHGSQRSSTACRRRCSKRRPGQHLDVLALLRHYDLKERTKYYAGEEITTGGMLEYFSFPKLSDMLEDYDHLRRGRIPPRGRSPAAATDISDPTRAPPGAGIFHAVTLAPYSARGRRGRPLGRDQGARGGKEPRLLPPFHLQPRPTTTSWRARLVAARHGARLPRTVSSMGTCMARAPFMYQTIGHRPTPDLGQYTVPGAERLYLVGPFMHPGGGRLWRGPRDGDTDVRRSRRSISTRR